LFTSHFEVVNVVDALALVVCKQPDDADVYNKTNEQTDCGFYLIKHAHFLDVTAGSLLGVAVQHDGGVQLEVVGHNDAADQPQHGFGVARGDPGVDYAEGHIPPVRTRFDEYNPEANTHHSQN